MIYDDGLFIVYCLNKLQMSAAISGSTGDTLIDLQTWLNQFIIIRRLAVRGEPAGCALRRTVSIRSHFAVTVAVMLSSHVRHCQINDCVSKLINTNEIEELMLKAY